MKQNENLLISCDDITEVVKSYLHDATFYLGQQKNNKHGKSEIHSDYFCDLAFLYHTIFIKNGIKKK